MRGSDLGDSGREQPTCLSLYHLAGWKTGSAQEEKGREDMEGEIVGFKIIPTVAFSVDECTIHYWNQEFKINILMSTPWL